ncbi:Phosphoenolpyruvate-protein phosphotransferase of PTS system [Minicystis rosea]|nr:Phosphoenolpyruvate-protein phosphotransferase of PTS system [Minicystis rosea]
MSAPRGTLTPVVLRGIAGSPGVAIGKAVVLGSPRAAYVHRTVAPEEVASEIRRYELAVAHAQQDLREMARRVADRRAESSILEAYVLMVGDETLAEAVRSNIQGQHHCAEWAVANAIEAYAARLAAVNDPYLRERSHDVEFIGERLLRALGGRTQDRIPRLDGQLIIVAHDLSPADTAGMVDEPVGAFITEMGTRTSHTSIMARALEIPAVVGVADALKHVSTGDLLIVDGIRGIATVHPSRETLDEAKVRVDRYVAFARGLQESRDRPPATKDGVPVSLRANVELPAEAILARDQGAAGIGLYRTEFLYIDRISPPTEDEQYEIFRAVVEAMSPRPVTLRTFDIGGDKFASSFKVPPEMNPMLGLRAVRLALSRPEVFLDHLRAMVRASAHGEVKVMIPMVSNLLELRQVRALLKQAQDEVRARGQACADEIPLGVMIEVPAAAVMVDLFAEESAFLSLGTNDLIQYALAVDRTSQSMAYLASPFHPAVLRMIAGVVRAGEEWDCPVSVCGAMASDPLAAILLLGLGLRDLSMEAAAIPEIKETLRRVTLAEAEAAAAEAMRMRTAEEIEHLLAETFAPRLYDLLAGEA